MARGTAKKTETIKGADESRWVTGTMAMLGDCAAIAKHVAEQTGQMCEADGATVKSAQKWNCAPRKMTLRSTAKMRMRCVLACMCLLRISLGKNGCVVKCRALAGVSDQATGSRRQAGKMLCKISGCNRSTSRRDCPPM